MKRIRIDKLGRVVIPMSCRKTLGITENTDLIIDCDGGNVNIRPVLNSCKLCGAEIKEGLVIALCERCINKVVSIKDSKK